MANASKNKYDCVIVRNEDENNAETVKNVFHQIYIRADSGGHVDGENGTCQRRGT